MTNLANKPPLGQKEPKKKKDAKFLNKVREKKCCVCERFGEAQISPTTAHHPIHDRRAIMNLAHLVRYSCIKKDSFTGRGLPSVYMRHDTDVSICFYRRFSNHLYR